MISAELLYRGTQHGWKVKDFHLRCDQKGPTLVIGGTKNGQILGGFTSITWDSLNSMADPHSFIFSMGDGKREKQEKGVIKAQPSPLTGPSFAGLTFGMTEAYINGDKNSQV